MTTETVTRLLGFDLPETFAVHNEPVLIGQIRQFKMLAERLRIDGPQFGST